MSNIITPAMAAALISTYKSGIDALIDNFGKPILLYFNDIVTETADITYDDVLRDDNFIKPSYKQTSNAELETLGLSSQDITNLEQNNANNISNAPIKTQNTKTIKALVKNKPRDMDRYDIRVNNPDGIVRLKTRLLDVPDLERCKFMVPNADSMAVTTSRYILLRKAFPFGLGKDGYAITFWSLGG